MISSLYEKWCKAYEKLENEYLMPYAAWYLLFYISLLILNPLHY